MVSVSVFIVSKSRILLFFSKPPFAQGKWGWCEGSCYEEQLIDGFEYCGNHSYCVNNDDDTRGLTCECESGYTSHRIYFGEAVELRVSMQKSKLFRLGCRDLDECSEGGSQCGVNTDCYNTDGDHECVCKIGFEGSPSTGHKFVCICA